MRPGGLDFFSGVLRLHTPPESDQGVIWPQPQAPRPEGRGSSGALRCLPEEFFGGSSGALALRSTGIVVYVSCPWLLSSPHVHGQMTLSFPPKRGTNSRECVYCNQVDARAKRLVANPQSLGVCMCVSSCSWRRLGPTRKWHGSSGNLKVLVQGVPVGNPLEPGPLKQRLGAPQRGCHLIRRSPGSKT